MNGRPAALADSGPATDGGEMQPMVSAPNGRPVITANC